jgi:hypothetical protein
MLQSEHALFLGGYDAFLEKAVPKITESPAGSGNSDERSAGPTLIYIFNRKALAGIVI